VPQQHVQTTDQAERNAQCPICSARVGLLPDARLHEVVACGECAGELEVIGLEPPALAVAPEIDEDWGE
jgi:alpha-aminoadipate carrier protein LysW